MSFSIKMYIIINTVLFILIIYRIGKKKVFSIHVDMIHVLVLQDGFHVPSAGGAGEGLPGGTLS